MATEEIMSAIFLLAVLFLVLPSFLSTNSKLKQFIQNKNYEISKELAKSLSKLKNFKLKLLWMESKDLV